MTASGARATRFPFPEPPAPGEAVEVAEGVLWMRLPMPTRPDHVNVYALDDGEGWTLVDTGLDGRRVREIWDALLAGPLGGRPARRVVATHHHPDHMGLAGWFQKAHGAELWTTRTAWLLARMLRLDEQPRPTPETMRYWRGAGMDPAILAERAESRPLNYCDCVAEMPLGFRRIAQGGMVSAAGRDWRVEIGHGHAPEQATLWSADRDLVLAGDQILPGITPNLGVYATEPGADTVGDWLDSCRRLAGLAGERHLVLPGHGLPFIGLPDRLRDLIAHQEEALDRLRAALARPRSAAECFDALYGRRIGAGEYGLALVEAVGHLNHLLQRGEVTRRSDSDGVWRWSIDGTGGPQ